MSGSWRERLDARLPLRARDVEAALRELGAASSEDVSVSEAVASDIEVIDSAVSELDEVLTRALARIDALEAKPSRSSKASAE
jgi:hypothetical protein